MGGGVQLAEVLAPGVFQKGHLPGAINIPLAEFTAATTAKLDKERPVIVYCYNHE